MRIRNDPLLSDEFSKVGARSQQRTLKRLDKAYTDHADTNASVNVCNSEYTMLGGIARLEFPMQTVNIIKHKENGVRGTLLAEQYR